MTSETIEIHKPTYTTKPMNMWLRRYQADDADTSEKNCLSFPECAHHPIEPSE